MTNANRGLEALTAAELGRAVLRGEVSPTEVIRFFENRIEARNPSLNAFVYTRFEEAETRSSRLIRICLL